MPYRELGMWEAAAGVWTGICSRYQVSRAGSIAALSLKLTAEAEKRKKKGKGNCTT